MREYAMMIDYTAKSEKVFECRTSFYYGYIMNIKELITAIESQKARSAWDNGVKVYAIELAEGLQEDIDNGYFNEEDIHAPKMLRSQLLNGARDWSEYSWGGCSLIYNQDIAKRLCAPYELKKTRNGERRPNSNEEWLDTQARALHQACNLICRLARYGHEI